MLKFAVSFITSLLELNNRNSLAGIGTLHLEFAYLSDITGDPIYRKLVENIRNILKDIPKPDGLYRTYVDTKSGKWDSGKYWSLNK